MSLADFPLHFLRPWWWLALAPLPLALWALARGGAGRAALARLADARLLPHLLRDTGTHRRAAMCLVAAAWLIGSAALAGPAWRQVKTPLYVNGAARVVVLSLSRHMLAQDLKPDRLTRARFAVRDLLDTAGDAHTALVAYAGAAFTVAPLTSDKRTVLNLLRALAPSVMPVPGNNAAAGIEQGVGLLRGARVRGGEIVLITDNAGPAAVAAAAKAHAQGVRVDVLGIGTTQGAPVPRAGGGFVSGPDGALMVRRDDAALRAVAGAGGGVYAVLPPGGGLTPAFAVPVAVSGHASHGERTQVWLDGGAWLLPILLLLAALGFRRGWLLALAVLAVPVTMPAAHAATWSSWWANPDQRALQALHNGNPQQARELAATPGVRGAADYRAGDYADAAKSFARGQGARSRYNLGNALAKAGKFRQAIAAYTKALQLNPDMVDARANRAAVRKWLTQHAQPQRATANGKSRAPQPDAAQHGNASRRGGRATAQSGHSPSPRANTGAGGSTSAQGAAPKSGQPSGMPTPRPGTARGQTSAATSALRPSVRQHQSQLATQALQRELAQHAGNSPGSGQAFALGRNPPAEDGKLTAQQRAMLRSVADDPGALLRRKFRLEWQQRQRGGGGS